MLYPPGMTSLRIPRGYVGRNHEIVGSDIVSVLRALEHLSAAGQSGFAVPARMLGAELYARVKDVSPDGWYPISWMLEPLEALDAKLGRYALIRIGRTLFTLSHHERVVGVIVKSGYDVVHGIDAMYHHAHRGVGIGGWKVVAFDDTHAELEKTTPVHCAVEEGILAQALSAVGARSVVRQTECFRDGGTVCRFVIDSGGGRWDKEA